MARLIKYRRIAFIPGVNHFRPEGIPLNCLEKVRITLEEAEAIRLKDLEYLKQEQCAEKMEISRQTFQRILNSGRHKIADALLNGRAIEIEGGHFEMAPLAFKCSNGHEWKIEVETLANSIPPSCPVCKSENISLVFPPGQACPCHGGKPCCEHCPRLTIVANILTLAKTHECSSKKPEGYNSIYRR